MKRIILITLVLFSVASAQNFDGVGLGLAGSYTVTSRGIDALSWNPANIALPRGNTMELNLVSLNAAFFNNAFSFHTYNRYFTHDGNPDTLLDAGEKRDFLNLISDDFLKLNSNIAVNVFGLAFNNFAMAIQVVSQSDIGINKKPLEMALYGEDITPDYEYYVKEQLKGSAFAAVKVSFGYAYPLRLQQFFPELNPEINPVAVGVAVNYYLGLGVAQVLQSEMLLQRFPDETGGDNESLKYMGNASVRFAGLDNGMLAGRGRGFDFGLSGGYGSRLKLGISFSNLGASIDWNNNTQMAIQSISDSIKASDIFEDDWDANATKTDTTMDIASFSTPLPSVMRIGGAFYLMPTWLVMAEWQQGLNHAFGNSTTPRLSVATEYKVLNWLPVRGGIAIGGKESFLLSMGFGLHLFVLDFDYSFAMKNALWPTHSEGLFQALSLKIKL